MADKNHDCPECGNLYKASHPARYLVAPDSPVVVVHPGLGEEKTYTVRIPFEAISGPATEEDERFAVDIIAAELRRSAPIPRSRNAELLARADEAIAEAKASGVLIDFTAAHEALDDLRENGDDPYVYTQKDIEFMAKLRGMTVEQWVDHQIQEITRPSIFDDLRQAEKDGKPLLINRLSYGPRVKKEEQTAALQCAQSVEPCPYCLEVGLHSLSCSQHPLAVMGSFGGRKDSGIGRKSSETARAFKVYNYMKEKQPALLKKILENDHETND